MILKGSSIMYENGGMIWKNKASQSFESLINEKDLIQSIELRYNGSVEKPIKEEINKGSNTRLDQYNTRIMIIINFIKDVKEYLLNKYHLFNFGRQSTVEFYNDNKSVNFERNVTIDLFGKTLFVEPTSSNEIKKTLEELKQQITDKKNEENTVLDRINNTINNIQNFNLDQYKKLPVEYKFIICRKMIKILNNNLNNNLIKKLIIF